MTNKYWYAFRSLHEPDTYGLGTQEEADAYVQLLNAAHKHEADPPHFRADRLTDEIAVYLKLDDRDLPTLAERIAQHHKRS